MSTAPRQKIKQGVEELDVLIGNLKISVGQIFDNAMDVKNVSFQNNGAISEIVKKANIQRILLLRLKVSPMKIRRWQAVWRR